MNEIMLNNILNTTVALFMFGIVIYGVWRYNKINKECDIEKF